MSTPQFPADRTPERIDAFIRAFFGPGNTVWANQDPTSDAGRRLSPLLQVLRSGSQVPVVLPRRRPEQPDRLVAYVVALDAAHATAVSEILTAFVGPSYSTFDGRPAPLDAADPVDRAVLEFAGPQAAFTIAIPGRQKGARAWSALELMQETVAKRPLRTWHVPKPLGRLLAEFEVALAAGDNSESAMLLEQISVSGGLTGSNVAYLRIKRLGRLGRDGELLRMPELADVVASDPPVPVKDAVLAAIYATIVATPLAADGLAAARANLIERGHLIPALANSDPSVLGSEAVTVLALAAWIRNDDTTTRRVLASASARAALQDRAPDLLSAMAPTMAATTKPFPAGPVETPSEAGERTEKALAAPASWPDLVTAVSEGRADAEAVLANETWRVWEPPAVTDKAIAAVLAELDDAAAERAWSIVGAFVDADAYQTPATHAAQQLINNALTHDRFSPGDLAGLVALTEIVLRSAPNPHDYTSLLDDLRAESDRWVGPERATTALDLADLLVRTACPDLDARLRLSLALLQPLHAHRGRLDPDQAALAQQLCQELQTGLVWPQPEVEQDLALADLPALNVLLYSLDAGALARTADALRRLAPNAKINISHDRVGSPQLKQHARHADVIAMATRCATHAATSFIRTNAGSGTTVLEADGSGSASLLRAVVSGLRSAGTAGEARKDLGVVGR